MVYRDDNCGIDPQMYCDSKLRDFFNSYQSMQDSFGGIRARLLRRGAELVRRWQKSPPIPDMDSGLNLWSEKNLDLIAGSDVSSGDIFLYLGEGLLRSSGNKAFWFFLPWLQEDNHIKINRMIYTPLIDNVENMGVWVDSLTIPDLRHQYAQLLAGIVPEGWI